MSLEQIRQQAYNELDKLGFTKLFDKRPKDAIPPVWEDLWFLYQKVRERKPEEVLEFGSGCSSIIIAQALYDNNNGRLFSFDNHRKWLQITWDSMSKHLIPFCDFTYKVLAEAKMDGVLTYLYYPIPAPLYSDILYVDGPELTDKIKVTANPLFNENIFNYMIIDGRWETVDFLEKHLKGKYDIQRNYEENRITFERIG